MAKLKDLEARCRGLTATLTLVRDACIIFELPIDWSRLPEGEAKQKLITAVDNCSTEIPLGLCLKEIGLSTSRYYPWRKLAVACQLSDAPSCPKLLRKQEGKQCGHHWPTKFPNVLLRTWVLYQRQGCMDYAYSPFILGLYHPKANISL